MKKLTVEYKIKEIVFEKNKIIIELNDILSFKKDKKEVNYLDSKLNELQKEFLRFRIKKFINLKIIPFLKGKFF